MAMKFFASLLVAVLCTACHARPSTNGPALRQPNVVVIFTDDQGFGDLSCYGHPTIHTPHVDALAAGGAKFTQFYVASPVCSPSRAALLTGCYPKRVGMHEHVIFPAYDYGLHSDEVTIADFLGQEGYATGCFGKWHLGHRPGLMPTDQGFDTFFGVPYSNDMSQMHRAPNNSYKFRLPLIRDNQVIEWEPDQHLLTRRTTEAAVDFIESNTERPFFLYMPHSMPHIPIYASEQFEGTSRRGLYGDVIEEIDWSVGEIVSTLERNGLLDNTLIIFTTDNGPWLPYKLQGGSAGLLRGGKGTNWEGGQRVPFVAHWPAAIPKGLVCTEVATTMDILPTVAALIGSELPAGRTIDGHDISALLRGEDGASSPTDSFLYYTSKGKLAGVRQGPWKLLLEPQELYQIEHDVSEQWNVADQHPNLVVALRELALERDAEITANARPVKRVAEMLFDPAKP
ncbi:MAG: arylsulfatase A [Planctomycetota bacterium]|jgi:arylsulfatase A